MRLLLAVVAGIIVAALGANILGEYEFSGLTPLAAGALFGLAIAELVVGLGKVRAWPLAVVTAIVAAGGVWWAVRISTNFGLLPVPAQAWAAVVLAGLSAAARVRPPRRPAADSPPPP